jgi:DNA processing protein
VADIDQHRHGHGQVELGDRRLVGGEHEQRGERRALMSPASTENVGPVAYRQLMGRFGAAIKALDALPDLARRGGRAWSLRIATIAEAEAELQAGERLGAQLITVGEAAYSPLLAAVDPPPPVLWARGRAELLSRPCVAIVGARIASAAGQRFARGLAADLGQQGQVIVSGMARGVDGAAHEGALPTGTVAVLGGGVDDAYPPEHRDLYDRLVEKGCVVSESVVGHRAQARDFPRRNRIISGLCLGVVVVEAELRSGSLITARLAAEQGREVFAVPGSPLDPRAKGPNDLLRQGATICEGAEDVLRALEPMSALSHPASRGVEEDARLSDDEIDRAREKIAALLSPTPTPRDELARAAGFSAAVTHAALVELALAGRVELLPGGLVAGL